MAPRIEVYTQLACVSVYRHHTQGQQQTSNQSWADSLGTHALPFFLTSDPLGPHIPEYLSITSPLAANASPSIPTAQFISENNPPSSRCGSDPAIQKEAARIQTTLTTTMGLLSALSTGWWGHFSERHGRTRVLALSTLGLFITDLAFILVATPGSRFAAHGHILLVIAPFIEGLLGGWSTVQSTTSAYVSDCTSPGSRATIFSRFIGIFFLGTSIGPVMGGWIIRNGIPGIDRIGTVTKQGKSVTEVFWLAIILSFVNFLLASFLFPEPLSKEQRAKAKAAYQADLKGKSPALETMGEEGSSGEERSSVISKSRFGVIRRFLSPFALFLPVMVNEVGGTGMRKRRDWSLTFLALAMFLFLLSVGVYQIKHLYAAHTYNWAPDELSYYISFLAGLRSAALLFLLPAIISAFKPKPTISSSPNAAHGTKQTKPKPTKTHLASEIRFDLLLARCCIFIDILSPILIFIIPPPSAVHQKKMPSGKLWISDPTKRNMILFVLASGLSSVGSGFLPACQSLALCIVQARQLPDRIEGENGDHVDDEDTTEQDGKNQTNTSTGKLFGALSTLQAVGQMILGPMIFGLLYANTVAYFPKAIFVVAGGFLTAVLVCSFLIRNPVESHLVPREDGKGKRRSSSENEEDDSQRGRSRVRKDLFGYRAGLTDSQERSNSVLRSMDG
ncbi:hypothetical protein GYMLUDRAFT_47565 [Collybiopsis luxurians FD-317 M1]|uniref:MFS general substrate transporter n=1 Tax=Collybiopsis luxurians FD-317 M1 TaxID=944289 RepID=A0A0D0CKZ7_9AGAR|nr:hypothetical protein GYMLUDRAFT_47565 [Collybiopsis luxurians FD-317 M1]